MLIDQKSSILCERRELGLAVPCTNAGKARYGKSLIFICKEGKGIKTPAGIMGFEDGKICPATCFDNSSYIPKAYLSTGKMRECLNLKEHNYE